LHKQVHNERIEPVENRMLLQQFQISRNCHVNYSFT